MRSASIKVTSSEKNKQVSRMGDIYRHAIYVISWMGEPDEHCHVDLIFDVIRAIRPHLQAWSSFFHMNFLVNSLEGRKWIERQPSLCQPDPPESNGNVTWDALKWVMDCDYWTRIWTIQERVAARSLELNIFVAGSARATFADITSFFALFDTSRDWLMVSPPGSIPGELWLKLMGKISVFLGLIQASSYKWNAHPMRIVLIATYCTASDPRDMIYGLQGVS
ncbi:hypothetical protein F5B20DRAFT_140214 [Whalleya microplaca]|nr:hypothetical protein F5B20DRAFT_140214 [Whalleya microplaca]